jgi:hypothetical protein
LTFSARILGGGNKKRGLLAVREVVESGDGAAS